MDRKRDWTLVKEDQITLGHFSTPRSHSIKVTPTNRSFSEYVRARNQNTARRPTTPTLPQLVRPLDIERDRDNLLDEVIEMEESSRSIERRFILTEEYVSREDTPSKESVMSSPASRSLSKRFERKLSELNKEIGRLEAETWKLRKERRESGKIIRELREQLDILLSRQECLTKDLNKTMVELEDQKKMTQTIKEERDSLRQRLDVYLQKEVIQSQKAGSTFYCTTCDSKLFTRSHIVSEVRCLEEGTAYIVKLLECEFTLGPQTIRNFPSLSKLLRVRSLYCDGCLKPIGYKFSSADEIIGSMSCKGEGRYWIENKRIESGGSGNHKHQRSLEDDIFRI